MTGTASHTCTIMARSLQQHGTSSKHRPWPTQTWWTTLDIQARQGLCRSYLHAPCYFYQWSLCSITDPAKYACLLGTKIFISSTRIFRWEPNVQKPTKYASLVCIAWSTFLLSAGMPWWTECCINMGGHGCLGWSIRNWTLLILTAIWFTHRWVNILFRLCDMDLFILIQIEPKLITILYEIVISGEECSASL